jgi:hypothetical protein
MCHIYKFKWAKYFGYSGLILFIWEENDNDQVKHCILLPRPTANPPLMVWSVSREVVPRHRQLPLGDTSQSEMDGSNYFMPLPKRSREVVFTSSTVTLVTLTE